MNPHQRTLQDSHQRTLQAPHQRTLQLVQFSVMLAIEALFCFTPLGSLPALGPIVATLGMVPVIITAILLGTRAGTLMGAFAGTFSFIVWTFMPPSPVVAFIFTPFYSFGELSGNLGSLLICFVPRILVGTVAGFAYGRLSKAMPSKTVLCISLSAILGSLTNTFGVMGGIWLFFGAQYETIAGAAIMVIVISTIVTSGIPEAIVSAVIGSAVCKPLFIVLGHRPETQMLRNAQKDVINNASGF
ncbi:MAG: ECF transporter S component [Peptococcaceae bacterium]|nr:ECF transporter S component [Peptococcaceae bacterium]